MTNDGGIKRGDRADTGDLEARPSKDAGRAGSGVPGGAGGSTGHVTADPSALAGAGGPASLAPGGAETLIDEDMGEIQIERGDPGLTNVPGKPAEDWAADTEETRSGESSRSGTTADLRDDSSTLGEKPRRRQVP